MKHPIRIFNGSIPKRVRFTKSDIEKAFNYIFKNGRKKIFIDGKWV